jgi:hippurate hydrolase
VSLALPVGVAGAVPEELQERLVGLRHDLHRRPELSLDERETQARLRGELERLVPAGLETVADTGLVARIAGRDRGAPVVAVRGDIDALPITEATGAPFASEVPGKMHACGHDVHAAWAVGAAALLAAEPAAGDVLVVLQPAEEIAQGAEAVLESGALDGAAAIFGGHVDLRFEIGQAVAQAGPLAASADTFRVSLAGGGAHGARPHEARDPVVGGATLVCALQTVVSRRLAPGTPAVVTVGSFHAGTAPNVIPDRAELAGTLRAQDPAVRAVLLAAVESMARAVGALHGLEVEVGFGHGAPPLVNPERGAAWARRAVAEVLGEGGLRPLGLINMAGEDFAAYLERMPGCFLRIGARRPGEPVVSAHSPRFLPADEAVVVGAALLARCARVASSELAGVP